MPTLVLNDMPAPLLDQILRLAQTRQSTPGNIAIQVLETALRSGIQVTIVEPPLPSPIFLTEEICAPFSIPRPEGKTVVAQRIHNYVPQPHDIPEME